MNESDKSAVGRTILTHFCLTASAPSRLLKSLWAVQDMKATPSDAPRLIQSALADLGWEADASVVAEKVRRLDIGLPCEDEFSVVCGWLGKCQLLHKLDQQQIPVTSREKFQVPDLLALFATQNSTSPVLIEVKSRKARTLSFTPDYLKKLTQYAELLKLPLLIAWKHYGIWTLFEAKHLRKAPNAKNFKITLNMAMRENILGVLAGDVAYRIGAGAGIHLQLRKEKMLGQEVAEDGRTEDWSFVVEEVAFTDYHGQRRADLDSQVTSLFNAWDLEEKEEHTDSHINLSFVAGTEGIQAAHMALVRLLTWGSPHDEGPNWRHLLQKEQVTANIANFEAALDTAFRQKVVCHIFHQVPHSFPDFISPRET
jgi:Holliday junction resolvase